MDEPLRSRTVTRGPTDFLPFPRAAIEQSISSRFDYCVRHWPERVAISTDRQTVDYQSLAEAADGIARAIVRRCGAREEPLALLFREHSVNSIAATLAALKAGRVYVPLDSRDPLERLRYLVQQSEATCIATDGPGLDAAHQLGSDEVVVLNVEDVQQNRSRRCSFPPPTPDRNAYIYFTSGSTGKPKGVVDSHRNVLHNVMRYTNNLVIRADDRLSLIQSPGFSGSVSSMFGALLNGATVCPYDVRERGFDELAGWLRQQRITIYHSVPSIFRHWVSESAGLPDLRLIRLEGDKASRHDIELFKRHSTSACQLVNGLGTTETGLVSQYFVTPATTIPGDVVPVGYATEDMKVSVVDEDGRVVPPSEVGEIAITSRYLAIGYWNNREATEAAFAIADEDDRARVYRTGDIGRIHADGCLEYLGRTDSQPKVRGQRIEIEAIEQRLMELGNLEGAVAEIRDAPTGDKVLVAYFVAREGAAPHSAQLRQHLGKYFPESMVPSVYVPVDALPFTTNGKLDRKSLPDPWQSTARFGSTPTAARTGTERRVAAICEEALGMSSIGVSDDLLDLGADSLRLMAIRHEIHKAFGVELPIRTVFETPTVAGLATLLEEFSL